MTCAYCFILILDYICIIIFTFCMFTLFCKGNTLVQAFWWNPDTCIKLGKNVMSTCSMRKTVTHFVSSVITEHAVLEAFVGRSIL